jgi:hypothetical protein
METKYEYVSRGVGNTSRCKKKYSNLLHANGTESSTGDDTGISFKQQREKMLKNVASQT